LPAIEKTTGLHRACDLRGRSLHRRHMARCKQTEGGNQRSKAYES
jgi:hypothetical protein